MFSFLMKKLIRNEFDKVVKEFTGGDDIDDGMSGEEVLKDENRRAAEKAKRKVRQDKFKKEREEARQKIRDKYNIKKTDGPSPTNKKHEYDSIIRTDNARAKVEKINASQSQGFDSMKMTSDTFTSRKRKFGWK